MPRLTINGQEVEVPQGTLLIEACARVTEKPPHFCYHPGLRPDGNCRMCMVKIEGMRGVSISCTLPAAEGMVVSTEHPEVLAARRGVMEFLLIHHPLDCPVCDKAGECILQDHSYDHGRGASRYIEPKIVRPKRDLGPRIALWPERCIRCSRCTRFLDEVTGTSELAFFERGDRTDLDIFPGRPIDNPLSLNIVDICPVGALISKDFLFRARVWNLRKKASVCAACSRGCNVVLESYEGKLTRLVPRPNPHVNHHWMCDHGRLSHAYVHDPRRPRQIVKREDARSFNVALPEALEAIRAGLEAVRAAHGAAAVGGLVTAWLTNEELHLAGRLLRDVLGARRLVALAAPPGEAYVAKSGFRIAADRNPNRAGLEAVLGLVPDDEAVRALAADIETGAIRALLVLGGMPAPAYPEELVAVASRLELLVVQDLVPSALLDRAHIVLPAAAAPEKHGSFINDDGRVQRLEPLLVPPVPGGDLGILGALLRALGDRPPGGGGAVGVFADLAARNERFQGLTFQELGDLGRPRRGAEDRPRPPHAAGE
ncbi:MAG: (2Fe-2S)-binding protein [Planctomycetes bacterium]|nr:(2Fe-2S)-binding protein [Planctomycetota bacterium]